MADPAGVRGELAGAQSVDRALRLLTLIGRYADEGASLSMLVEESRLNKPTARRLLMALMRAGLVDQDNHSRRYHLGEESFVLGTLAARRYGIDRLAQDSLLQLAELSGDTAFLSVRRDSQAVCLRREEGWFPIRTHVLKAGDRHPLGLGAGSLALLAELPDGEVEAMLAVNRQVIADRYPRYSPELLRDFVRRTRAEGYALNPGLIVPGSWGIGVAIRGPDGAPAGALSIAAIESRLGAARQRELAAALQEEARRLEAKFTALTDPDDGRRRAQRQARRTNGRKESFR